MADLTHDELLARLSGQGQTEGPDPWAGLAASQAQHAVAEEKSAGSGEADIDALVEKIRGMTGAAAGDAPAKLCGAPSDTNLVGGATRSAESATPGIPDAWVPFEPTTFEEGEITSSAVESLILKLMLSRGDLTGREIHDHLKLPFRLIDEQMRELKMDQLVVHKGSAPMNDYLYQLTDVGRERARRLAEHCTYFGAAPVSLAQYIEAVSKQSITKQNPSVQDLKRAFEDLLINPQMLRRLGPAINSGRGLFLFGPPGNGKTSIAERVTKAFGQFIWIPRAIGIDGEIIRLFDPNAHELAPLPGHSGLLEEYKIDKRWVAQSAGPRWSSVVN